MGAADDGAHSQNEKIDIRFTFWPLPDIMVTSTSISGTTSRAPSYSGLTPISSVSCRPASIWRMGDKTSQMTWYALILNATFYFVSGLDSWLYYEKEIFYDTFENISTSLGKYIDSKSSHCVSSTSPKKALCQLGNALLSGAIAQSCGCAFRLNDPLDFVGELHQLSKPSAFPCAHWWRYPAPDQSQRGLKQQQPIRGE